MKHTPKPWTAKGHFVTAETPIDGGPDGANHSEFYGGYLVCESVSAPNGKLIAVAPDLLEVCKAALPWIKHYAAMNAHGELILLKEAMIDVIQKAEGAA